MKQKTSGLTYNNVPLKTFVKNDNIFNNFAEYTKASNYEGLNVSEKNPSTFLTVFHSDSKTKEEEKTASGVTLTYSNDFYKAIKEYYNNPEFKNKQNNSGNVKSGNVKNNQGGNNNSNNPKTNNFDVKTDTNSVTPVNTGEAGDKSRKNGRDVEIIEGNNGQNNNNNRDSFHNINKNKNQGKKEKNYTEKLTPVEDLFAIKDGEMEVVQYVADNNYNAFGGNKGNRHNGNNGNKKWNRNNNNHYQDNNFERNPSFTNYPEESYGYNNGNNFNGNYYQNNNYGGNNNYGKKGNNNFNYNNGNPANYRQGGKKSFNKY